MKKLFLATAMMVTTTAAYASPILVGNWKSNRDLTMSYVRSHARLEPRTEHFLDQMMGQLILRFGSAQVSYKIPDLDVDINGECYHMAGFDESSQYKVLFSNDNTVAVRERQPISRKEIVTVYNFVDANTMWVYQGSNDKGMPDLNIREYFVRVK